MFHNDWSLLQLAKERERDIVRKLEHNRLVREAELTSRPHRHTLYHVLDWVGRQLVRWQAWHAMHHRRVVIHTSTRGG
jgi:hypothetical protein